MDNNEGTAKKITTFEMRCLRRLLNISYMIELLTLKYAIELPKKSVHTWMHSELLAMVIAKKLRWFGHVIRSNSMSKIILQCSIEGTKRRGRPKMQWQNNIVKWNGIDINKAMRAAENRERYGKKCDEIYCAPTA